MEPIESLLASERSGRWGTRPDGEANVGVLRSTNLRDDGGIDYSDVAQRKFKPQHAERDALRPGDIILERSGGGPETPVGRVGFFEHKDGRFACTNFMQRLRPDATKCLPRFLAYCLWHLHVSGRTEALQHRTTGIRNLDYDAYLGTRLPVPPRSEQESITTVLLAWDRAAERISKLAEAKRRLKTGLMQQLLTGRRRFPEFDGPPWREYRLGDLFDERKETGREDLPLLSITDDDGVIPRQELDRKDTSADDKSNYKRIAPGDIGYNTMRMWQGRCGLSELEGIVSPAYTICVPGDNILPEFAAYLFKLPQTINLFYRYSQGLVSDTLTLRFSNFAEIKVTIPAVAEQRRIAEALSTVDREIDLLERQAERIREQNRGLMQKLLTGEVRTGDT